MFIRYNYFGCFLCCCSVPKCQILCDPMDCSMPSLPVFHCLLEFAQIQVHCVDDAILSFHPLLPSSPLALSVSQHQGLLQWIGFSLQVAKVLEPPHPSFQWIFRIDWFDLLAVQGTLKSLLQHHNLKASAFFMVLLSHPYMTTEKTIALTIWTLAKWFLCFLICSLCLSYAFLSFQGTGCSHHLQWFLEPKKIKSVTASTFFPFICHEVMGPDAMILVFLMLSFKLPFSLSSFTLIKRFSCSGYSKST